VDFHCIAAAGAIFASASGTYGDRIVRKKRRKNPLGFKLMLVADDVHARLRLLAHAQKRPLKWQTNLLLDAVLTKLGYPPLDGNFDGLPAHEIRQLDRAMSTPERPPAEPPRVDVDADLPEVAAE
jgi:hypothetical protein